MRIPGKLIGGAIILLGAGLVMAQQAGSEQPVPFEVRKTGVVNVVKDREGKVAAIRLVVTSYEITLDEAAKPLETMDGYKVRVTGTFNFDEQNRRWITVKNIETISAPATETAPAATNAPAAEPSAAAPAAAASNAAPAAAASPTPAATPAK